MFTPYIYQHYWSCDEDLEAGRILRFSKTAKMVQPPQISTLLFCFLIRIINVQLGNHNRFLTDETLFKRKLSYGELKVQLFNGPLYYNQNILFLNLVVLPMILEYLVESFIRIRCNALYCRINPKCCIPISYT